MEPKTVVVKSHEMDSFGNTRFTDKDDNEYKVGEKRPKEMHDLIQDGVAVQLFYKVFNDNEYISDVKSVEGELPEPTKPSEVKPPDVPPKPKPTIGGREGYPDGVIDGRNLLDEPKGTPATDARSKEIRSMICYKEIGELVRADKMDKVFGDKVAPLMTSYYSDFIQKNL